MIKNPVFPVDHDHLTRFVVPIGFPNQEVVTVARNDIVERDVFRFLALQSLYSLLRAQRIIINSSKSYRQLCVSKAQVTPFCCPCPKKKPEREMNKTCCRTVFTVLLTESTIDVSASRDPSTVHMHPSASCNSWMNTNELTAQSPITQSR